MTIELKWLDHRFGNYGILKSLTLPRAQSGRLHTRQAFYRAYVISPKSKGKRSPRVKELGLRTRPRKAL